jgi:hypothetical protein
LGGWRCSHRFIDGGSKGRFIAPLSLENSQNQGNQSDQQCDDGKCRRSSLSGVSSSGYDIG